MVDGFGVLVDGFGGSGDVLSSRFAHSPCCPPMTQSRELGRCKVPVGAPGFVCPLQGDTFRGTGGLWELSLEGLVAQLVSLLLLRKEKGTGGRNTCVAGVTGSALASLPQGWDKSGSASRITLQGNDEKLNET